MTIEELIAELKKLKAERRNTEKCHKEMDRLLLRFIGDKRVTRLFNSTPKWYS